MGAPASKEDAEKTIKEQNASKEIEIDIKQRHTEDMKKLRLLLLGPGESGKSTLLKQMVTLYGSGYTEERRLEYKKYIHDNILESIKTLIMMSDHGDDIGVSKNETTISAANKEHKDFFINNPDIDYIDEKIAQRIDALWKDSGILNTFEQRSKYQLPDGSKFYFDRILEIGKENYVPTFEDLLRTRVRTSGVIKTTFFHRGKYFEVYDVGGQKSERRKWMHVFSNVTAVIFVVASSEYDQVLFEDGVTNRIKETLTLFERTCNDNTLYNTSMILFLNKIDLLKEKISKSDLSKIFPEYKGGGDYNKAIKFLDDRFNAENKNKERTIYTHYTCATNTNTMRSIFEDVREIISQQAVRMSGLIQ